MDATQTPTPEMLERVVDGERFQFPAHRLHDFEFWFGTENPFKTSMFAIRDGKVNYVLDTGMCGNDALITRWVPVVSAMQDKCNAIHLGPTEEKKKLLLFGTGAGRGKKLCPSCKNYVAARKIICRCGHKFYPKTPA